MFAILPFLFLVIMFLLLSLRRPAPLNATVPIATGDWRSAALAASAIAGMYAVIITNAFSAVNLVRPVPIGIAWALAAIISLIAFLRLRSSGWQLHFAFSRLSPFCWALVTAIAALAAMMCMIALIAPPNNWDSQVYHMPRIMHWLQNHNVALYPTLCPRQNHQNMGAEFIILQFQALMDGGDRFANMPHWLAYAGSILAASLIAKLLGARARGQVIAAVFAATGPMAILQSTSTQSDMLSAYWTIVFVYYAIRWLAERTMSFSLFALIGSSLALATLTKSTAYTNAAPFILWLGIGFILYLRRGFWKPALLITAIFFLVNGPMYYRNIGLYEHPLGPRTEGGNPDIGDFAYTNPVMSPAIFASNYIRNLAIHMTIYPINNPEFRLTGTKDASKTGPLKTLSDYLEKRIKDFHKVIGVDPNDFRFTFGGAAFTITPMIFNDENDGDPLHLALLLLLSPLFLVAVLVMILTPSLRAKTPWNALFLWLAAQLAFILFCLTLRWQPWHSRLHIVFFLMFAPVVGFAMDWLPKARAARWPLIVIGNAIAILFIAGGFLWGANNMQRSLRGPASIFKNDRDTMQALFLPGGATAFKDMALFLKDRNVRSIGILQSGEPMEYGYWYFLRKYMSTDFQMLDLFAAGFPLVPETYFATPLGSDPRETARCRKLNAYLPKMNGNYKKLYEKAPFKDFNPDAIIHCKAPSAGPLPLDPDGVLRYKNRAYKLVWTSVKKDAQVQNDVYMPADKVPADAKVIEYPAATPSPSPVATPQTVANSQ